VARNRATTSRTSPRKPAAKGGRTSPAARRGEDRAERRPKNKAKAGRPKSAPERRRPKPPLPEQHQEKPGLESKITPRPKYTAPTYRPANKLEGMVALITGGDSGIGRAVAVLYAREGADVAIAYLPAEREDAEETCDVVEAEGRRCLMLEGDLTDAAFCEECVERTVTELGHIDILVSNAAWQNRKETIEEVSDEEWDRTFKTNVYAYFRLAKAAVPHMKPGSAIIASSSETSFAGTESLPDYAATKGAINTLTMSMAKQLIDRGIRVNAVAPGPVWTPLNIADQGTPPEKIANFGKKTPIGRPAQPEEVAPAYVFLASQADSGYIAGEVIRVLGGSSYGP
jgi:NAD(P)-dependent dehydrogenase (short-subunit alcohol dehydrogenase family)